HDSAGKIQSLLFGKFKYAGMLSSCGYCLCSRIKETIPSKIFSHNDKTFACESSLGGCVLFLSFWFFRIMFTPMANSSSSKKSHKNVITELCCLAALFIVISFLETFSFKYWVY